MFESWKRRINTELELLKLYHTINSLPLMPDRRFFGRHPEDCLSCLPSIDRRHVRELYQDLGGYSNQIHLPLATVLVGSCADPFHHNPKDIDLLVLPLFPWDLERIEPAIATFAMGRPEISQSQAPKGSYWPHIEYSEECSFWSLTYDQGRRIKLFVGVYPYCLTLRQKLIQERDLGLRHLSILATFDGKR